MAITTTPDTQVFHNGTGSQTSFSFSFVNSFEDDDVFVYVWNATTSVWDKKTKDTDYTQSASSIDFVTAPASGTENVLISRKTDIVDPKVDYTPGSSVRAQDLDNNQRQVIQRLQELENSSLSNTGAKLQGNLDLNNYNITQNNIAIGNLHVGSSPPDNPTNGSRWFDTISGRTYIYYTDVDSSGWVDTTPTYTQVGTSDEALPLAGGTMTGHITLHANPTSNLHAATKQYVDGVTGLSDGDKGDITVASSGASWTIDDNAVDAAAIADNAVGLDQLAGVARGKIIYGDASGNPAVLAPGSNGQVLKSDGTDIAWGAVSGSGTVTEVTPGTGLLHGSSSSANLTTTGTLNIDVGTTANKILQLDGNAKIPAVDGSQLTNITPTIADNSVTGAKIALGSDAAGDIMYYNGTDWARLAIGSAAQILKVNSGANAPEWGSAGGSFKQGDQISLSPDKTVTRTVVDRLADTVHLEDFAADDGSTTIVKGTAATNAQVTTNTQVFKNALATGKTVRVPEGTWMINDTLVLDSSHTGLIGDESLRTTIQLIVADNSATPKPAIKLQSTGSNEAEYMTLKDLHIQRKVATVTSSGSAPAAGDTEPVWPTSEPTTNYAGVALDGSNWSNKAGGVSRARIENLRIGGFVTGMAFTQVVGCKVQNVFVQQRTVYNTDASKTGYCVGFHFIGDVAATAAMSPLASIELNTCQCDMGGTKNIGQSGGLDSARFNDIGFFLDGKDLRDIFLTNCETVQGRYGIKIKTDTTDDNWDIHIIRPIIDAFKKNAISIEGAGGTGAINIQGGYGVGRDVSSDDIIGALNSNGITVQGFQFLGLTNDGPEDDGINLENCSSCSIIGNRFLNLKYGVSLKNSNYNTIVGNVISASAISSGTDSGAGLGLNSAIRFYSGSSNNTFIGNTIKGRGTGSDQKYADGIRFDGSSVANNVGYGNKIDSSTVTSTVTYVDASTTTNILDPKGGIVERYTSAGVASDTGDVANLPTGVGSYRFVPGVQTGMTYNATNSVSLYANASQSLTVKDNGQVFMNCTSSQSNTNDTHHVKGPMAFNTGSPGTNISICVGGTRRGYIGTWSTGNASNVIYSSNSDYRLKENINPLTGGIERLKNLKPSTFNWKEDETKTVQDGFIAHEVQEVVPQAVGGEKDGEHMQTLDPAKLVPLLTAALQELTERVEALEAK